MKKTLKFIKDKLKSMHLIRLMFKYLEDLLIVSGLIIIVKATFLLSKLAGMYCLGFVLLMLGIYFAKNPPSERR